MHPHSLHLEHALRRNGVGARVLVALLGLGMATDKELSAATGAVSQRIRWAIEGFHGSYRASHALEPLGLVATFDGPHGQVRALTDAGEIWARWLCRGVRERGVVARAFRDPFAEA